MPRTIRAKYRKGVFEPVEPVMLDEEEEVEITLPEPTKEDVDAFLRSAGSWKDIVPEEFIAEIHRRRATRRDPIDL